MFDKIQVEGPGLWVVCQLEYLGVFVIFHFDQLRVS